MRKGRGLRGIFKRAVTRYSFVISLDISVCFLIMEIEEFVSEQKSVREENMT